MAKSIKLKDEISKFYRDNPFCTLFFAPISTHKFKEASYAMDQEREKDQEKNLMIIFMLPIDILLTLNEWG